MRNRKLQVPAAKQGAVTQADWRRLMIRAIELAERNRDPRLTALREAQSRGANEQCLRRFSIIGESDLNREFPTKG